MLADCSPCWVSQHRLRTLRRASVRRKCGYSDQAAVCGTHWNPEETRQDYPEGNEDTMDAVGGNAVASPSYAILHEDSNRTWSYENRAARARTGQAGDCNRASDDHRRSPVLACTWDSSSCGGRAIRRRTGIASGDKRLFRLCILANQETIFRPAFFACHDRRNVCCGLDWKI